MTPTQIPDITQDESFKADAIAYVNTLINERHVASFSFNMIDKELRNALYKAYMRGLSSGFRTGWLIGQKQNN